MEEQTNEEIDLLELIMMLLRRWYIIVASVVVIFGAVFYYAYFMVEDDFTASRTYAVSVEEEGVPSSTGHSLAERLVNSYIDFSTSKIVLDELRVQLVNNGITEDYTNEQLRRMINVSQRGSNSIAVEIKVTSNDAELSALITNELFNVIDDLTRSDQIQNLETIDSWGVADVPNLPSGPNRLLYVAIGVILGGMIGVFTVFVIEFLDKSIKSSSDVERHLGLRVLGVIPEYDISEVENNDE